MGKRIYNPGASTGQPENVDLRELGEGDFRRIKK